MTLEGKTTPPLFECVHLEYIHVYIHRKAGTKILGFVCYYIRLHALLNYVACAYYIRLRALILKFECSTIIGPVLYYVRLHASQIQI